MKILYITNGVTGSGGLERVLSLKTSFFVKKYGHNVTILTLNEVSLEPFYQFHKDIKFESIVVSKETLFSYMNTYKTKIQEVVSKIQPDVIFVCDDGLKGFFLPKIIKTPAKWIYERHVSKLIELPEESSFFKKCMVKVKFILMDYLSNFFDCFVVLTDKNKREWLKTNNIRVIPNPLSFDLGDISDLDSKSVICVGKISYQKGQDNLIKIWEKIHEVRPDWKLKLYGKEDLSYLDTSNLEFGIEFYPPTNNIREKYLESSIYVMPSRFEGFGMVLIEAMSCGLPVISFDCPFGPSDIITDGVDGFLIENGNLDQFYSKLLLLINDLEKRNAMGHCAFHNVERFALEPIMGKWESLLREIIR